MPMLGQLKGNVDEFGKKTKNRPAFEIGENPNDFAYPDGMLAQRAIESLDTLKDSNKPFFLGAVCYF